MAPVSRPGAVGASSGKRRAGTPGGVGAPYSERVTRADVYVSPTRVPAGIAVLLAVLGLLGIGFSLPIGISAALDGSGSGALLYTVLIGLSALALLASVVLAVVCLVRGLARYLAGFALLLVVVPAAIVAITLLSGGSA
jgi:hypothetical protein